jgi:hypothetical protein
MKTSIKITNKEFSRGLKEIKKYTDNPQYDAKSKLWIVELKSSGTYSMDRIQHCIDTGVLEIVK